MKPSVLYNDFRDALVPCFIFMGTTILLIAEPQKHAILWFGFVALIPILLFLSHRPVPNNCADTHHSPANCRLWFFAALQFYYVQYPGTCCCNRILAACFKERRILLPQTRLSFQISFVVTVSFNNNRT